MFTFSTSLLFCASAAHCGAAKGQLATLKVLHLSNSDSLWLQNNRGDVPLHEAVHSGRKDLVRWMLADRPDATAASNNEGRCPLHVAALNNSVEMCKVRADTYLPFRSIFVGILLWKMSYVQ